MNWTNLGDAAHLACGDSLLILRQLPDESVDCCVTSPPYFGLRDYGVPGQIGLEATPELYVARLVEVFRQVRRVLKPDGTLWLNLGDTYASAWACRRRNVLGNGSLPSGKRSHRPNRLVGGLKEKDLIGIPWAVAFALQEPYYTGPVKAVCDQVWLAAMIDAEGSICGTEYQTGDRTKTNIYVSITNTSVPVIEKCDLLFRQDLKHIYEKTNGTSNRKCFRWDVERMDQKALFLRTVYPHLVAKRKQAIIGYTFIEMQRGLASKKNGYLTEQHEQRSWLIKALSSLNSGKDVDIPDWCIEPPSLFEQGFYLRQDIIWEKRNCMPEPVTDRCTKAHEYLFLLAKSARYFFDAEAIKEPLAESSNGRATRKQRLMDRTGIGTLGKQIEGGVDATHAYAGLALGRHGRTGYDLSNGTRNRRSVWTVATKPYRAAHFATYPPNLIEPCILAGCPEGGTVLDPFNGSGTTGVVCVKTNRRFIGIDLNGDYLPLAVQRITEAQERHLGPLFMAAGEGQ